MLSFTYYKNVDAVVVKLLKFLSINIDPAVVIEELEKHPDYPSLLAISDVLENFEIENSAFRLKPDELQLITYPFLAHVNTNGGDFLIVNKILNEKVLVSNEHWNHHKMSLDEFKKAFSGIVLTAERAEAASPSKKLRTALVDLKAPFVITGLLLIFLIALVFHTRYFEDVTWQVLLLTLFKTAGLIVSVLLLVQSIDSNNPLVQKLCGGGGSNKDCNAILSSKAAKAFDWLSWSEVGFFYFSGTWLALLFGGHSTSMLLILAILNIVSLPYTFYSIYYQARVAKRWCTLCCTVQGLLWLEFIPLATIYKSSFVLPDLGEWSGLFIVFFLPAFLWMAIKPLLLKLQQLHSLKQQLRKFKYNTELFNKMLNEQPKYSIPADDWSIVLGNVHAGNSITMVTNPYCPPCSKTHKFLDQLLDSRNDIQARIVFTASNTEEDIKTPVSRHLMALNELQDKTVVKNALNDWYEQRQKNYAAWAKAYPVELIKANYHKLDHQKEWCEMAEVVSTPTLLLNGHKLPDLYTLIDLKYMLI